MPFPREPAISALTLWLWLTSKSLNFQQQRLTLFRPSGVLSRAASHLVVSVMRWNL